ncbi:MAG: cell division protein ZapA [Spirochaetaceae bacterium]|nr:MAG: cell division protein ZapA [Spirochaetaceae bacterium]
MSRSVRVQVHLLGSTFFIQTDEDPKYVQTLLSYVEKKVNETSRMVETSDPLKISIISSMMIADELFQARQNGNAENKISQITLDLIEQLDRRLHSETDE